MKHPTIRKVRSPVVRVTSADELRPIIHGDWWFDGFEASYPPEGVIFSLIYDPGKFCARSLEPADVSVRLDRLIDRTAIPPNIGQLGRDAIQLVLLEQRLPFPMCTTSDGERIPLFAVELSPAAFARLPHSTVKPRR